MQVDLTQARRIAQANAGRRLIGDDEITTTGIAALTGSHPATVRRWAADPASGFPASVRTGVFRLDDVVAYLRQQEALHDDTLLRLAEFAALQEVGAAVVRQYADHPYLVQRNDPANADSKGRPRWRYGDLVTFWYEIRPSKALQPRGRPDPLLPHVRAMQAEARAADRPLDETAIIRKLGVGEPRARRLLTAAARPQPLDDDQRTALAPRVEQILRQAAAQGIRVTGPALAEQLSIRVQDARALLAEAREKLRSQQPPPAAPQRTISPGLAAAVQLLRDARAAGTPLTGSQVAAHVGVKERQGFRLLAQAKKHLAAES
ncbi:hypothetical protein [Planomonospora parontospora]|uniref:hypothetical protein n=1 Tax=Planomonospora parontospora TaxID=58119 RepID=UPI001670D806|nr:hypothetical protein [Planomonospora parontospora]GGL48125.1 hypothetical protein GCM10014719_56770 [Planomonospora parontospora subsp. antibiotica]GII18781.1 hypothetical protein Ppa05_55070 [Planomonospora parontospora subsp. antibiotica]